MSCEQEFTLPIASAADVAANTAAIDLKANSLLPQNEQTGASYTIVAADKDYVVVGNRATAQTFTAETLTAGTLIAVAQAGAGQITVAAGGSLSSLRAPNGAKTAAQYKGFTLWWRTATEVWILGEASA